MKKYICILLILISSPIYTQQNLTSNTAYGYAYMWGTFSVPILPGFPINYHYGQWNGEGSSMCLGGNGIFYLVTRNNTIHKFDPLTLEIELQSTSITGLVQGDIVYGIAYNYENNIYYLAASNFSNNSDNIYKVNVTTGAATLIGPTGTGGVQADLTIDCNGNCYSIDPIKKNAYKINLTTGAATLLGPLGFNLYGDQGMDYDRENGIVYLTLVDSVTLFTQLRQLNTITGETTLIRDWGPIWVNVFATSTKCYNECQINAATDPNPTTGSFGIPLTLDSLRWENDPGATHTQVYFGKIESLHLIYDGPVTNSVPVPTLENNALYTWRIISGNETCLRYSPTWMFGTTENTGIDYLFEDDFENGLANWTIENNGGYCDWEIFQPPYPNHYIMPASSSGGVMAADGDNCGVQTSITSTATINQSFDFSSLNWVWLEFDSDWKNVSSQNHAIIDVSTNNGASWTTMRDLHGNEIRTSFEIVDASLICAGKSNIKFRFRSNQQNWGWWWIIDNLNICGMACPLCTPRRPSNLNAYIGYHHSANLYWVDNSYNEDGFSIERKTGDSLSTNQFEIIGTCPENQNNFIDTTVSWLNTYTYRVNAFNENGYSTYSNLKTILIFIPVELTGFSAIQINNQIKLNWTTATELNNLGFEVQRKSFINGQVTNWSTIGFRKGFGTTTEPKDYSFIDEFDNISVDTLAYRLKQIDFDGRPTFSNELILATRKSPADYKLFDNFPNPFNPTTTIAWESAVSGLQTIRIYDMLGQEVTTVINEYKSAGKYETEFNASNLPSGIYFYRLTAGSFIQTKKMILLK